MISKRSLILCLALTIAAGLPASTAFAQAVGADDYVAPDDDALPCETSPLPPTEVADDHPAVHATDETPPTAVEQQLPEGDFSFSVRVFHADDEDLFANHPVALHAVWPPGPLQSSAHRRDVEVWHTTTDDNGIARFDDLPDDLASRGLLLQARTSATVAGGTYAFESDFVHPDHDSRVDLPVYDATGQWPGIRVRNKRVLVSPWEDYLVFDQFWTIELEGDQLFDPAASDDPALERGIPLRLPYRAEGISFAGPGAHEVITNVVYWKGVLQPNRPITVQVRFSKAARGSFRQLDPPSRFTFEHPMQYPVDDIQILIPVETSFEKVPRMDDLSLIAPGFEVGTDPRSAGLFSDSDFLVATGHSIDSGESYAFRLEGLPFSWPFGGWIALFGGILAAIAVAFFGRREYRAFRDNLKNDDILRALQSERDDILDELAAVTWALDTSEDPAEIDELQAEETLLRQRLALILGKIEELDSDDDPSSDAEA